MEKLWYVVNTYSGHENKVKEKLEMRAESMDMKDYIYRVIVPEEKVIEEKDGVKKEMSKVHFPNKTDMLKYSVATISFVIFFGIYFYLIQLAMAFIKSII